MPGGAGGLPPIQPGQFVVLHVGVVVALLGTTEFVASGEHGFTPGEDQGRQQGALIGGTGLLDGGIVARALRAVVPALVVGGAVAIVFAVGVVVLFGVADQVGERETVVGGDEVDAGAQWAIARAEQIGTASQAGRQGTTQAFVAAPEAADVITKGVVPLLPGRAESTDLMTTGADVPGLGHQPHLAQDRILGQRLEQWCVTIETAFQATQRRCQVEAEAVDAGGGDPVAQAVQGQAQRWRAVECQAVAATHVVDVARRIVWLKAVVAGVVQATEVEGRAQFVAFAGVVEDHVEQHLEAGRLQGGHGLAQFAQGIAPGQARIDGGHDHRVVAPVVGQPQGRQMAVVGPGGDGQQFQGGDTETLPMLDQRRMPQRRQGPTLTGRNLGMQPGLTADVQLVDQSGVATLGCGRQGVERRQDDGLGDMGAAVALVRAVGVFGVEAIGAGVQLERPVHRQGPGIHQQFLGIESEPVLGPIGALGAQPIS